MRRRNDELALRESVQEESNEADIVLAEPLLLLDVAYPTRQRLSILKLLNMQQR